MWNIKTTDECFFYHNQALKKLLRVAQQSVNGVYSMSRQVERLEGFGEEAETGWRLPEFVVILNTELKVSWCLLETAGNQRADREQWKGQRTSSIEKGLSERGLKTSERYKRKSRKRLTD